MDALERRMVESVDRERLIARLQGLLRYPSFSATEGERALAQWVAGAAAENPGVRAELSATPEGRPSVLLSVGGADGHYGLMLNGHIDTNMVSLGWTRDPFGGECDDGFIYGIGVSNMKAAVAAMWEAVTTVAAAGVELEGGLVAAFVCGELQGGVGTKHLIDTGLRSDAFIVGEPTDLAVLTRHAGAFSVDVEVRGEMRHMSKAEEGVNAVLLAGQVLRAFEDAHGISQGSEGLTRINVGAVRGGTGPEMQDWRSSMVPDRCLARVACRIEPGDTPARFVAHLQEIAERAIAGQGGHVEVTMADQGQRLVMGPFDVPTNDPFVSLVGACYREVTGKEPVVGEVAPYKYYGTDGAHLRDAGMIGVVCGPGGKYNTMPDERVAIADIVAAARLYTLAALRSCAPRRT